MRTMSLNQKLAATIVLLWLALVTLGVLGALQNRASMLEERREQLRLLSEEAFSIIRHFGQLARIGAIEEGEAQRQALDIVSRLRYAKDGYFAVINSEPRMIMHPIKPSLTKEIIGGTLDANGVKVFEVQVEAGKGNTDGGFASYSWPKPGNDAPVDKLTFVKYFPQWDWHLSTGMYMDDIVAAVTRSMVQWMLTTLALGVVTTLVMLRLLGQIKRSIGGEMALAVENAHAIAKGDLRTRVPVSCNDQTSLMYALSVMYDGLVSMVSHVRKGTEHIGLGTTQIATENADLSRRTEKQATALIATASSMEQITAAVRKNADSAAQASYMASTAAQNAARGSQSISEVVSTMSEITQSAQEIQDIIGVIDSIAFQTNILALNAAVEAARAGEQGRGFAVVATEVRSLAQRSAAAAKQIKILIETSTTTVSKGECLVVAAGATMNEIVISIDRVNEVLEEISRASSEQSIGIKQVNVAINELDAVTQQNAALVERAAAAAMSLKQQAETLCSSVKIFALPTAQSEQETIPVTDTPLHLRR